MTSEEALNLIVKIAGLRLLVRANRFGCDSDLVRQAHDHVLDELDRMRRRLSSHIDQICEAWREPDPDEQDDLLYHLVQCDRALERDWYEWQPAPVGGWNRAGEDGSFVNPVAGHTETVGDFPVALDIPPERLCGLPEILDEIAAECRIHFTEEIVFYRPKLPTPASQRVNIWASDPDGEIPF